MNDQITGADVPDLPALSDATVARIEGDVFAAIASERSSRLIAPTRAKIRRRRWLTGAGIAAAFVVGVLVTPQIMGIVDTGYENSASDSPAVDTSGGGTRNDSAPESAPGAVTDPADASGSKDGAVGDADREIIQSARATVSVKNVADAARSIAALAEKHGGYVESTEIGKAVAIDSTAASAPADSGYGWISIRVPSADLTAVIAALGDSGEVLSSSTSKQDVTTAAIDLRARVDATRASVQRLTALMAKSGTVSELIEAEVALTDRQALLESYEQQLAALEDQVAMSSVHVELTRTATVATTDPAGFGDGLLAGWNGLIVSLNAVVIAVGFILPWLGIVGVALLVFWLVRRARIRNLKRTKSGRNVDSVDVS